MGHDKLREGIWEYPIKVCYGFYQEPVANEWSQLSFIFELNNRNGLCCVSGWSSHEDFMSKTEIERQLKNKFFSLECTLQEGQFLYLDGENQIWAADGEIGPCDTNKIKIGRMPIKRS